MSKLAFGLALLLCLIREWKRIEEELVTFTQGIEESHRFFGWFISSSHRLGLNCPSRSFHDAFSNSWIIYSCC